jgi:hypothetical protein
VGPCPKCGGEDRFSINARKQLWNCRRCKPDNIAGDVIGFVMWCDEVDFIAACRRLANEPSPRGSNSKDHNAQPRKVIAEEQEWHLQQKLIWADQIWRASSPLGQDAITYFARRGIDIHAVQNMAGSVFTHCARGESERCRASSVASLQRSATSRAASGVVRLAAGSRRRWARWPTASFEALHPQCFLSARDGTPNPSREEVLPPSQGVPFHSYSYVERFERPPANNTLIDLMRRPTARPAAGVEPLS